LETLGDFYAKEHFLSLAPFLYDIAACYVLCAWSDYETPQQSPDGTTTTNGTTTYARLRQSTRPDADTNRPAGGGGGGGDGYEIPIPTHLAPLPPRVHAYANTAEQPVMGKYYYSVA